MAKTIQITPSRVEQAMGSHSLKQFFERTVSNTKGKPAGPEFIALIADKLQLQMKGSQVANF